MQRASCLLRAENSNHAFASNIPEDPSRPQLQPQLKPKKEAAAPQRAEDSGESDSDLDRLDFHAGRDDEDEESGMHIEEGDPGSKDEEDGSGKSPEKAVGIKSRAACDNAAGQTAAALDLSGAGEKPASCVEVGEQAKYAAAKKPSELPSEPAPRTFSKNAPQPPVEVSVKSVPQSPSGSPTKSMPSKTFSERPAEPAAAKAIATAPKSSGSELPELSVVLKTFSRRAAEAEAAANAPESADDSSGDDGSVMDDDAPRRFLEEEAEQESDGEGSGDEGSESGENEEGNVEGLLNEQPQDVDINVMRKLDVMRREQEEASRGSRRAAANMEEDDDGVAKQRQSTIMCRALTDAAPEQSNESPVDICVDFQDFRKDLKYLDEISPEKAAEEVEQRKKEKMAFWRERRNKADQPSRGIAEVCENLQSSFNEESRSAFNRFRNQYLSSHSLHQTACNDALPSASAPKPFQPPPRKPLAVLPINRKRSGPSLAAWARRQSSGVAIEDRRDTSRDADAGFGKGAFFQPVKKMKKASDGAAATAPAAPRGIASQEQRGAAKGQAKPRTNFSGLLSALNAKVSNVEE